MAACITKKRYVTSDEARTGLVNIHLMHSAWNNEKIPIRFYRCPDCRGYHLTAMTVEEQAEAFRRS